jgi:lipopolysaccharide transport system permease protein
MEITSRPESLCRHLNPAQLGRDLWGARAILLRFSGREVSQRYRGSRLGGIWIFLQPLFLLAVYTIAFGLIVKTKWPESRRAGLGEVAMAVYCGLTAFGILSECASRAPTLLAQNQGYVKRAMFPVQMLPLCVVLSAAFHALVNLVILIVLGWLVGGIYAPALLAPLVLVPLILFSCGITLVLSAIGPMYRDLRHFIAPALLAVSFLTPLVYSPSIVPQRLQWLVLWNPLAFTITSIRRLVMWQGGCDWLAWGLWLAVGAGFMVWAYALFMKLRHEVTDLV